MPPIVAIIALAIAAFVSVATIVQAIKLHSWGPIWAIGWLPAVLLASLSAPSSRVSCWARLRRQNGQ